MHLREQQLCIDLPGLCGVAHACERSLWIVLEQLGQVQRKLTNMDLVDAPQKKEEEEPPPTQAAPPSAEEAKPEEPAEPEPPPKTVDELRKHGGYRKRALVRVGQARVMRTRPIFPHWQLEFKILWDDTELNAEQLRDIVEAAGKTGAGDWRPRFGRFRLESLKV